MRKLTNNELYKYNGGYIRVARKVLTAVGKDAWRNRQHIKSGYRKGINSRTGLENLR
ncbi:hypothetical protein [Mammaliicoccus sciuri]|uniref:hypothetical protein n=1 Tax=Mammaliicoccus sciuri TaxID=1296 RepID=UPI002B25BA42|nr:hypothetical protein [Mammaliicoccus sciuri]MEB7050885.1 hypothetical protein [Mammaliicoccus sciuri]WQK60906.1 hypothetical protein P3U10_01660 [Mammaliicoccus sciuri]